MPTTESKLLTYEQLTILIRGSLAMAQRVCHSRFCDAHPMGQAEVCKATTEAIEHLDALCATVKHLWAELATTKGYWADTSEDLASAWLKVSEIEERLAQVEKERDSTATAMRDKCVAKMRERLHDSSLRFADDGIKAAVIDWTNMLIRIIESLDQVEQEKPS